MIQITNKGPHIARSNYWQSDLSRLGAFYLSVNAGAFRLLIPEAQLGVLAEIATAREVIISKGLWTAPKPASYDFGETWFGREMVELFFEDHTERPYVIHISLNQVDRNFAPVENRRVPLHLYAEGPTLRGTFDTYMRRSSLPCLRSR